MAYIFHDQAAQDDAVARALRNRELEHHAYEVDRLNYLSILATPAMQALPAVWPSELLPYKSIYGETLAGLVQGDQYALVTQLQFRDRVQALLATTQTEQAKCAATYQALLARIADPTRFAAAVARQRAAGGKG